MKARTREPELSQAPTRLHLDPSVLLPDEADVANLLGGEPRRARAPAAHRPLLLAVALIDLVAVAAGLILPGLLRYPLADLVSFHESAGSIALIGLTSLVWISLLSACEAYSPGVMINRGDQLLRIASAALPAWLTVTLLAFWLKVTVPFESRLVVGFSLPATLLCLGFTRLVVVRPVARSTYPRLTFGPILIVGDTERVLRIARETELADRRGRRVELHRLDTLTPGRAASLVSEQEHGEVIVDPGSLPIGEVLDLAFACNDQGAVVTVLSGELRQPATGGNLGVVPLLKLRRRELAGPDVLIKRLIDVVGATVGAVVLSPVFAGVAIAIKLNSPGPVIFRQDRVGFRGRRFRMYKFRTMHDGNDPHNYHEYVRSFIREGKPAHVAADGTVLYKPANDPRVTPVGAWLRRLSLDELPQLWNVLRGEMSLVGPRPCLPCEWELYQPWQRRRFDVIPGCTGLWQVTARSRVRFEQMVVLDLYYANHGTLLTDVRLVLQTVPAMLAGRGAY